MKRQNLVYSLLIFIASLITGVQVSAAESHSSAGADLCAMYNTSLPKTFLVSQRNGLWSDPGTWGGRLPGPNDNVRVNHTVTVDQGSAKEVQVWKDLTLNGELAVHGSLLVCNGGLLQGTTGTLAFQVENDRLFTANTAPGPVLSAPGFHPEDNGLWVVSGGTVNFNGPRVTSWLDAAPLNGQFSNFQYGVSRAQAFGSGQAQLAAAPTGWQAGDQLLLVTEQGKHSLARLNSVNGTRVSYTAVTDLTGYVLKADNYTISPKVANLSRRLKIVGARVTEGDVNHRAHTAYLSGAVVNMNNVEFKNLGPRGKLGRYPVHWHHAHESVGGLRGSSIWQSVNDGGNRFVVPHIVNGITVSDNVGFRSQGHGYFMEEVDEFNNVVTGNLSVDVRHGEELDNVDSDITTKTHHFWLRESNTISGNVAAGHNWDGRGLGNKWPRIDGMIVLPSTKADPAPLVTDYECLGCGGVALWAAVPNALFVNPASAYALTTGAKAWSGWNVDSSALELVEPRFMLNGMNELFQETGSYRDKNPWVSQIYINYGDIFVSGGVLAGQFGVHTHYRAEMSIDGTAVHGGTFVDSTYWELSVNARNMKFYQNGLFSSGYGTRHRAAPGLATIENACFGAACQQSSGPRSSLSLASRNYAPLFDSALGMLDNGGLPYASTTADVPASGFIRVPENLGVSFWSVKRAGSNADPLFARHRVQEWKWEKSFKLYGGYPEGFPPGEYELELYDTEEAESYIGHATVVVHEGLVSEICLDGQVCGEVEEPTLMVFTKENKLTPSGAPVRIEGYAKDLWDGLLTGQITWSSSIDGDLGTGSGFDVWLSDGVHRITATVTDSDGNRVSEQIKVAVGDGFSTRPSSSGSSSFTRTASVEDGVSIFVASASCADGMDPHWQCSGKWRLTTDVAAQDFVAYCPAGDGTYGECSTVDKWVKFGDLEPAQSIGACVGAIPLGGARNDCVNNLGIFRYMEISEAIGVVSQPGTDGTTSGQGGDAPDSQDNTGNSSEPAPVEQPTQGDTSQAGGQDSTTEGSGTTGSTGETSTGTNSGTETGTDTGTETGTGTGTENKTSTGSENPDQSAGSENFALFVASTKCGNGMDPHWQCQGKWESASTVTAGSYVAYCPSGERLYNACSGTDKWMKFSDLKATDAIGACVGSTPVKGARNECVNSFGTFQYVQLGTLLGTVTEDLALVVTGGQGAQDDSTTDGNSTGAEGGGQPSQPSSGSGTGQTGETVDSGSTESGSGLGTNDEQHGQDEPTETTGTDEDNPASGDSGQASGSGQGGPADESGDSGVEQPSSDGSTAGNPGSGDGESSTSTGADSGSQESGSSDAGDSTAGGSEAGQDSGTGSSGGDTGSGSGAVIVGAGSGSTGSGTATGETSAGSSEQDGGSQDAGQSDESEQPVADSDSSSATSGADSGRPNLKPVSQGRFLFSSGTLRNIDNNGTIFGGAVGGYVDNTDGVLVNVKLVDSAVVVGGRIVGSLTGTGYVEKALLDLNSLDSSVVLGYRTRLTWRTVRALVGMDLTGALLQADGSIDTTFKFLLDNVESGPAYSLVDVMTLIIDQFFENDSTEITVGGNHDLMIIANDAFEGAISLRADYVFASDLADGAYYMDGLSILVVYDGLGMVLTEM